MIKFWLSETFASIKKAQASFILSVISAAFAVSLVLASILIVFITGRFNTTVREKMSLNLFLKDDISETVLKNISRELEKKVFIKEFIFISKKEAADKFIVETGEDFTKIIDYNPLPASFVVYLHEDYVHRDSITAIQSDLRKIAGIDEVHFNADIYYKLIDYLDSAKEYIIGLTLLLIIISIYLVFSTNRLILHQRFEEMTTMKLIGSTLLSIKMPVLLNSVIIGLLAGGISLLFFILLRDYVNVPVEIPNSFINIIFITAALTGPLLGIITSLISMRKISIKI